MGIDSVNDYKKRIDNSTNEKSSRNNKKRILSKKENLTEEAETNLKKKLKIEHIGNRTQVLGPEIPCTTTMLYALVNGFLRYGHYIQYIKNH